MKEVSSEFLPSLLNPYFFVRRGIYAGVKKYSNYLDGRIMDFGCGSKPYRSFFKYDEYIGVDFENPGHPHDNEQIDIYYDGKSIPLESESVDGVLTSEVFEHVFNLPEILQELRRVMKKDACILITCPFVWKEHEEPYDFARYTRFALESMLTQNGFKKEVIDKSGNFVEVIFQLIVLFFFDKFYGKASRFWLTRKIYEVFFILMPNVTGVLISKLFPNDKKMYLNNIIVFRKC